MQKYFILLIGIIFTIHCSEAEQQYAPIFQPQTLAFHFYQIDIPEEIDVDAAINKVGFWGNFFNAYPIGSQQEFDKIVAQRIKQLNYKITERDLAWANKYYESTMLLSGETTKKLYVKINMTHGLYKHVKVDNQRHYMWFLEPDSLHSMYTSLDGQYYLYVPQLAKYITTLPTRFPTNTLQRPLHNLII